MAERLVLIALLLAALLGWRAGEGRGTGAADPVLEARMQRIAAELRCLVCQNQTIADSHAGLPYDLRARCASSCSAAPPTSRSCTT